CIRSPPRRQYHGAESRSRIPEPLRDRLEDEVGDLFFVLVNLARWLAVDPESALRKTNPKFRRRFAHLEEELRAERQKSQAIQHGGDGNPVATGQTLEESKR